jgi:hypothetical protein
MKITCYRLPVLRSQPEFARFCGVDKSDRLYINPVVVSDSLCVKAQRARVTVFVKIPEGIIALVPIVWAIESVNGDDDVLDALLDLGNSIRESIKAGAGSYHYPLASVSLPGNPAFTDAVLRELAGGQA